MAFENPPVALSELPRFSSVELSPVQRTHAWIGLVLWLFVSMGLLAVAAFVLQRQPEAPPSWLLPALVVLALAQCARVFAYRFTLRYALRSHDMIFSDGLFWRSQTIQPLCRVQHVEIERGPIEKRFNLSTLKLFSAGSSMATFAIPGLISEDAERLRAFVLDYTTTANSAHAPTEQGEEPSAVFKEPSATQEEPSAAYKEPSATQEEPSAAYKEPSAAFKEPSATQEEPSAAYKQPSAAYREPSATYKEPSAAYREPPVDNNQQ